MLALALSLSPQPDFVQTKKQKLPEASASATSEIAGTSISDEQEDKDGDNDSKKKKNRCGICRKKVGLTGKANVAPESTVFDQINTFRHQNHINNNINQLIDKMIVFSLSNIHRFSMSMRWSLLRRTQI